MISLIDCLENSCRLELGLSIRAEATGHVRQDSNISEFPATCLFELSVQKAIRKRASVVVESTRLSQHY